MTIEVIKNITKMKREDLVTGTRLKSKFTGNLGRISQGTEKFGDNSILVRWDNGNESYGPFTQFKNFLVVKEIL